MDFSSGFIKRAKQYFVYRNLHKGKGPGNYVYSLRGQESGLVEKRQSNFTLKDATFKISEKGRQRVLDEGRKNVHAGVLGRLTRLPKDVVWQPLYYNPKKGANFTLQDGTSITTAPLVRFTKDGIKVPENLN